MADDHHIRGRVLVLQHHHGLDPLLPLQLLPVHAPVVHVRQRVEHPRVPAIRPGGVRENAKRGCCCC